MSEKYLIFFLPFMLFRVNPIGKVIYFSYLRYFERLLDLEIESEEIYALNSDKLELYERKWKMYIVE